MAAATFPSHETSRDSRGPNPSHKGKQYVLLIEDNKEAMEWVQYSIRKHGSGNFELEWKEYLSDGLHRLLNGGIDLVLLDLGLPDCSGPFTATWIRRAAPKVPIVVLTGDESEESGLTARNGGINKYLVKGQVSCSGLVEAIRESLSNSART